MQKRGWLMKVSLLSISLLTTSAYATASAIPSIQETFPEQSLSSIELLTMLPTLMIALFVLLSIPISRKIGAKKTVLMGLIITMIMGLAPFIITSFPLLLASRALLGIGIGLFNSFAFSLISDFFEGDERAAMLGYQSSFQGIGGAVLTFLAGQLLIFGWHASFLIYLVVIPIFILFWLFVPEAPKAATEQSPRYVKGMTKYIILLFLTMVLYNAIVIKLPNLFITRNIGDAALSSLVFTGVQVASMVAGFAFGSVYKLLKRFTLPAAIISMGLGFVLISLSSQLWLVVIGAILTGIAFATYLPYLFNRAAAISSPRDQPLSSTLLIVGGQFAGFASPYLLAPLQSADLLGNPFASCFFLSGIILLAEAVIVTLIQKQKA